MRIRYPVPFRPLDPVPGSGIGFFRIPDLGSQTHIFESLVTSGSRIPDPQHCQKIYKKKQLNLTEQILPPPNPFLYFNPFL
jgi:hypothetical protein